MRLETLIVATAISFILWGLVGGVGYSVYYTLQNKTQNEAIVQFLQKQQQVKPNAPAAGTDAKAAD